MKINISPLPYESRSVEKSKILAETRLTLKVKISLKLCKTFTKFKWSFLTLHLETKVGTFKDDVTV